MFTFCFLIWILSLNWFLIFFGAQESFSLSMIFYANLLPFPLLLPFTNRLRMMTITTFKTMIMKITPSNDVKSRAKMKMCQRLWWMNSISSLTIGSQCVVDMLKDRIRSFKRDEKECKKWTARILKILGCS